MKFTNAFWILSWFFKCWFEHIGQPNYYYSELFSYDPFNPEEILKLSLSKEGDNKAISSSVIDEEIKDSKNEENKEESKIEEITSKSI